MPVCCSNPQCDAGPQGRQAMRGKKLCGRCAHKPHGGSMWCRSKGCGTAISAAMDCRREVCRACDLLKPEVAAMYCPYHAAIVRADARVGTLMSASSKISAFGKRNRWLTFVRRFGRPQLVGKAIDAFLKERGVEHLSLISWEDEKLRLYIDHYLASPENYIWGPKGAVHIVSFALQACRQAIVKQTTAAFLTTMHVRLICCKGQHTSQSRVNCYIPCWTRPLELWTNMECMAGL